MTAWDDFKHAAKERGVLACELYVVISKSTAGPDETKATVPAHLAYQLEQEAAGTLAFAGPMSNLDGDGLGGVSLIIYRAASLAQARSLAENDPMHKNGIREFTLRKWLLNEGSFNLGVRLSEAGTAFV